MRISVVTPSIRPRGLECVRNSLIAQTFRDFEWLVDINWTGKVDLNTSLNRLLKRSRGELIVFLQDWIIVPPEGLELFWKAHQEKPAFYTAPVGKRRKKSDKVNWDWRAHREGKIDWTEWEIDWASAPRDALFAIGGFDEELDKAWGFDNVNTGLRAYQAGYDMFNLKENRVIAYDHDATSEHPFRAFRDPILHNYRLDQIRRGEWEPFI